MGVEHPDWLPGDWKVQVRIRRYGRRDKYYINPSAGLKFKSQPEVLRYLKSSGKCQVPIESKQQDMKKAGSKTTAAANLPPGWIKQIRTTRKNGCKTRKDAYYIDPVSGHHFRSIPDVFRYLHSTDVGKIKKQEDECHPSTKPKRRIPVRKKQYRNLTSIMKSGKKLEKPTNVLEMEKNEDDDGSIASDISDDLQMTCIQLKRKAADKAKKVAKLVKSNVDTSAVLDCRLRSGSKAAASKTASEQQDGSRKCMRAHEDKVKGDVRYRRSSHSGSRILRKRVRSSYPVEEDEDEQESLPSKKKMRSSRSKCSTDKRTSKRLPILKAGSAVDTKSDNEAIADEETNKTGKFIALESSSFLEDSSNDIFDAHDKGEENQNDKASCSSLKDLLMDPCIEFAVKTLTGAGAIHIEDTRRNVCSSSPVSSMAGTSAPLSSIWSDPCFEFAVKTLTGELPMDVAGSKSQAVSVQKPLFSSGNSGGCSTSLSTLNHSLGQQQGVGLGKSRLS